MSKEQEAFMGSLTRCIGVARALWIMGALLTIYFVVPNLAVGFLGIAMISLGGCLDRTVSKILKEMRETGEDKL